MPNHSPYDLLPITDNDGDFFAYEFLTDKGVTYRITFTQGSYYDDLVFGDYCYQTSIAPIGAQGGFLSKVPYDYKVGQTVAHAIDSFFLEKRNIVVYVCYDDDERQYLREQSFERWYQRYMADSIEKHQLEPVPGIRFSMLYRSDNPFRREIESTM